MEASEKDIRNEIRATLEAMGCLVVVMHLGPIFVGKGRRVTNPNAGFPDLFGWTPNGVSFAIEVKKPGASTQKERREKQAEWREKLRSYDVVAFQTDDPKEAEMIIASAILERAQ